MSPEIADSTIKIYDVLCERVHADEDFNCRGYIPPSDVVDLAKDIEQHGLQQPITIQPYDDARKKATGFDFRIVQGHRRFTAITKVLKRPTISAMIKEGLSEIDALILNFGENLQRKALNIVQEAKALERLKKAGMSQLDVARTLRMERPWVQTRYYVLDFPTDIQDEIANGMLTQPQIHEIHALPSNQWYEAVRIIKDAKIKAGTKRLKVSVKKLQTPKSENLFKAKARKPEELEILLEHMMEHGEPGLHTRVLAWAIGEIDTLSLLKEFKKECDLFDKPYRIPTEGIGGL